MGKNVRRRIDPLLVGNELEAKREGIHKIERWLSRRSPRSVNGSTCIMGVIPLKRLEKVAGVKYGSTDLERRLRRVGIFYVLMPRSRRILWIRKFSSDWHLYFERAFSKEKAAVYLGIPLDQMDTLQVKPDVAVSLYSRTLLQNIRA